MILCLILVSFRKGPNAGLLRWDRILFVFFFAVQAAIGLLFLIGQEEDMWKLLLDGGDAAGVLTVDHIGETLGKLDRFLFYDLLVFDDVNGDVMVDVTKHVQIHHIEITLDL